MIPISNVLDQFHKPQETRSLTLNNWDFFRLFQVLHARNRVYYLKCDFTMKNVKRLWRCAFWEVDNELIKLRVTLGYRIIQRFYATLIER